MRIPWKRLAGAGVMALAFGFLVVLVRSQWTELQAYEWRLAPGWAALAAAGLIAAWLVEIEIWRAILRSLGGRLTYRSAVQVWFLSNIIRYIPGNIWQFLGMAELAAESGVARLLTLTSVALHQVISTAAGLVAAAALLAATGQGAAFDRLRPLLWLAPLGLLLLQPALIERALNWVLARFGRPPVRVTLTWRQVWLLAGAYAVFWLMQGLSFAALVRGLTGDAAPAALYLTATWVGAYLIGFLSLLTPSGLGVREGALVLLLSPLLPAAVAAVVALVARLWMVVVELAAAGVALLLRAVRGRE
ncbi:MAG: hypothetical protein BWY52_01817 [Chloroflexi bacterium ADurb.Bin325]|nr:MAG: hypothetical protein BWY52_01817 [Chloroflexi bacterium ADurb.Bin325]